MADSLSTARLEAFSDGVMAVIITIMVLELKVPAPQQMPDREALLSNAKIVVVYLLSFVQVGIYWVNHHYLLDDLETVSHGILWANLGVLFSLSFLPFGLEWIGTRGINPMPVAVYCVCFLLPAFAWSVLSSAIRRRTGVPPAAGPRKQAFSSFVTLAAVGVAFWSPWAALVLVMVVAAVWLVPPARIREKARSLEPNRPRIHHSS